MNRYIKLIITMIAIVSILCCVPVASAVDATEPTEATSEQATEQATEHPPEQEEEQENNDPILAIIFAIGVPTGCLLGQGLSFWKW